ncbi:MAG: Asp-tRNA(Asn)/Glu-tRNA(Gln) amidotransferase subunit GatC [Chitinophagaceae bacterium]|jgi:aspartyl-tRNA(Asn)/glutamyl-tRNA(Gln) amidotransferase subunit C|nr:Asp-tRNA(Asn)/Glu-tRNA(Gln) amidotransferase subunit GatC [Chitinophagaceae bacterium]
MEINEALIDQLANLARLSFTPAEKAVMVADMQRMIGFVNKLEELDTTGVAPLRYMGTAHNVLRPDEAAAPAAAPGMLKAAAHNDGQFFKVPKVIRK